MPDPKAGNAVVSLVAFYSAREAEYEAALAGKDQLLKLALAQGEEQKRRAAESAEACSRLTGLAAKATDVYELLEGAELNGKSFTLDGERADAFRVLMREVEASGPVAPRG